MVKKNLIIISLLLIITIPKVLAQDATQEAIERFNNLIIISTLIVGAVWLLAWWRRKKRKKSS